MTDIVEIEIPVQVTTEELGEFLRANERLYAAALDLSGDYYDRKSQVTGHAIGQIEVEASTVTIHYTVTYIGFRPCQDIEYSDKAMRVVRGVRDGRTIRFNRPIEIDRLSPADEL